ncbi:MAG TPA: histidine kinase [Burkholderiales bacterium]|nr:histidine kinase [Burkholderiales bacterium]
MKLFHGFGWRHVWIAAGFSLVVELAHLTYAFIGKEEVRPAVVAAWCALYFLLAIIGLGCAVAVDNRLGESAGTGKRLLIAMVLAAVVATVTVETLLQALPTSAVVALVDKSDTGFLNAFHRIAYRFSISAGWALLLIALYTMLQVSRRASARLHTTQLAALAAERGLVEADLRAMQARVEPDFLFAALKAVDQAYGRSVEAGEQALEALIAFLRAALPAETGGTSTVAAELDLVRAYAGVLELTSGPALELDIHAEPAARTQPIPAMLVLPLARWALDGAKSAALRIAARRENGALEIALHSDVPANADADTAQLAGVRARLEHLYGKRARLQATTEFGARVAIISVPA